MFVLFLNKLIFDLIKRRFGGEIYRANELDSKAGNMAGFVSVVIGLLLGGNSCSLKSNYSKNLSLFTPNDLE